MSLSTAQANSFLDTLLGSSAYLALSTADPLADGSGLAEPAGGSYARVDIHTFFAAASARSKTSNADAAFPAATAAWGTITHWAIMDAGSAGNLKWKGTFSSSVVINNGDQFKALSGQIVLSFS